MATWVRLGTGTAPSATNADLVGSYALDNATAPADFDPAAVTSVRCQWTVTGSGFSDDSWNNVAGCAVDTGGTEISQHPGEGSTNNQNVARSTDHTDSTGIPTGLSTAQWEAAVVRGNGTLIPDEWSQWNKTKGPDGSTMAVSALTVTITYTPATGPTYDETGRATTITSTVASSDQFDAIDTSLATTITATTTVTDTYAPAGGSPGYITNTGGSTSFVDTPDTDLADPSGDFELIVLVEMDTWVPTGWAPIITKHNGTGDLGYLLQLRPSSTNHLMRLEVYDATNTRVVNQDSNAVAPPSGHRWFRVVYDADNGASQHVVSWYYSDDAINTAVGSVSWTSLGVDTVAGAITSHPDTTAATMLMGTTFASNQAEGAGKLYYASIRYGGTEVADPDFRVSTQTSDSGATFTDSYGNVWTNDYTWTAPTGGGTSYDETGRATTITSTVLAVDTITFNELGMPVSVTATTTLTDQADFIDALASTITSTIASVDVASFVDAMSFTITATIGSTDVVGGFDETGRATTITATTTLTDVMAAIDAIGITVTATTTASNAQAMVEPAASFTITSTVGATDLKTMTELLVEALTATITGTDIASLADTLAIDIVSFVSSSDSLSDGTPRAYYKERLWRSERTRSTRKR